MKRAHHEATTPEQTTKRFSGLASINDNIIYFHMFDVDEVDINEARECANQIILVMKNGKFEMMPPNINTKAKVRDYIGLRYSRIKYWGVMPVRGSDRHPMKNAAGVATPKRDIYSYGK